MRSPERQRVVFDSGVPLGGKRLDVIAAARLGYVHGYWSAWVVSEIVRVRTEWVAERAARERCSVAETRRRLQQSRQLVNELVMRLSQAFTSVDYYSAPEADLSWLSDTDDLPIVQTGLAALADIIVSEHSTDFPLGEERNGILFLSTADFLAFLFHGFPEAEEAISIYISGERGE